MLVWYCVFLDARWRYRLTECILIIEKKDTSAYDILDINRVHLVDGAQL